jgi:hypothetical protein
MIYESETARRLEGILHALDKLVAAMASDKPKVAAAARQHFEAIERVTNNGVER